MQSITTVDSPQTLPLSLHSPRRRHHRPPAPHARGPRLPLPLRPTSPTRSILPPVCAACLPLPACTLLACLPLLACALRHCSSSPALQATLPPPLTRCCTATAHVLLHRRRHRARTAAPPPPRPAPCCAAEPAPALRPITRRRRSLAGRHSIFRT